MAKIRLKEYQCEPYLTFRSMYLEDQCSIATIAEKMGYSISKVQKYLEREGLTRTNLDSKRLLSKRTQHNSTFFDSIDTEEKAYWLGFFYADGYLQKGGSTLKIDLSSRVFNGLLAFFTEMYGCMSAIPTGELGGSTARQAVLFPVHISGMY